MAMSVPRTEATLDAIGYIRVSRKVQAEGHSPALQREALKRLARQEGYVLTDDMIEEESERGSKVGRKGYQRVIQAVREGRAGAVIVYMFDRWGRDGAEWLTRAREFDRLGVPIISVQEGKDEGGLMRFVRAGMAQHYSEQLAKRVLPAREKAAREGTHMGRTPFGYKRVYPAYEGAHRPQAGQLVIDEATAWVVRELFERYAAGGWSLRSLSAWMNSDPRVPRPPYQAQWGSGTLRHILRNPVYCGRISYNMRRVGIYEQSAPGSAFVTEGRHEGIISVSLWDSVQTRLDGAHRQQTYNSHRPSLQLATGLLRCEQCGGRLITANVNVIALGRSPQYVCTARYDGRAVCTARAVRTTVAHAALVAEVCRLRGAPWTTKAAERLSGEGASEAAQAVATRRALDAERERLRRHTRRMSEMDDDPTPEQIAAFREVSAEISARIRGLEERLAALDVRASALPDLRALHKRLTAIELHEVVTALHAHGDTLGLRELLLELVQDAHIIERQPAARSAWVRLEVTWTSNVQALLDAGLLRLDAPQPPPQQRTKRDKDRERWRRRFGKNRRYRV